MLPLKKKLTTTNSVGRAVRACVVSSMASSMLVRASRGAARAAASAASRCAAASSCVGSGGGGAVAASYRRLLLLHGSPAVASSPRFGRAGLSSHPNLDDDNMSCDDDEFYDLDCRFHVPSDGDDVDYDSESYSDDSDGKERGNPIPIHPSVVAPP